MANSGLTKLAGLKLADSPIAFTRRDAILYAIGVGSRDLCFIYEKDESFACLPTYSTCLKVKGASFDVVPFTVKSVMDFPDVKINPAMLLHGEQYSEFIKPLPPGGEFVGRSRILGVWDKGRNALLETEFTIVDPKTGDVYTRDVFGMIIREAGGWGGEKGASVDVQLPKRAPDAVVEETTLANQAEIFRLSGDYNPLHVDPGMAQMVGFKGPILHGLATYGFAGRAVLKTYCGNNPALLKNLRVRFANPVMPGDTLSTQMWKEGSKIYFQTLNKTSGKVALALAVAEIRENLPPAAPASAAVSSALKSAPVFQRMAELLTKDKSLVDKVKAVYVFNIKNGGSIHSFTVDAKNKDKAGVQPGAGPADCTITMDDADFFDLASGKLDAMGAFGQGKIKIGGNMMLAQKLSLLTQPSAKL